MEKKKPTIDEIYKLNVDGLFESTANWFDYGFKKSQAEINRDLYNKINGYSSSSESTGGNVSLGPLLTSLNGSNLYPSKGYLYYNGNDWEFNTPTVSGGGGGVVDTDAITKIVNNTIKKVSWWGQKINDNKVDGNIVITKGSHSFTIELDDNGNLKFNGNIYATGGITALGVGSTASGGNAGSTTGTLYFGSPNNNLGFNGSKDMAISFGEGLKVEKLDNQITVSATGGGSGGSGVTLSDVMSAMNRQLDKTSYGTPQFLYWNGSKYTWKNESEISGGSGGSLKSLEVLNKNGSTFFDYNGATAYRLRFGNGLSMNLDGDEYVVTAIGGGSGSSGTTAGKLRFYKDSSEESWNGEHDFKIIFGSGLNVSWDTTTHSQITLSATGGSSTGGSVDLSSYLTRTEASTTYAAISHSHSASQITGLSDFKVNNATNADQLTNSRKIWGQSFNGTSDINGNLYMSTAGGGSIQLYMNNGNMLDRTNNALHIGFGLKDSSNGEINLDAYRTVVYTDNRNKHYDFKSNVFDVNSNQIHFGSETNGGRISWDAANNAFKIEGNVYATGGITALGVSNNATTSNNVDFTFNNVSARGGTFENLAAGGITFQDGVISYFQHTLSLKSGIMLYSGNEDCSLSLGDNTFTLRISSDIIKGSSSQGGGALGLNNVEKLIFGVTGQRYSRYKFDINKAIDAGILVSTTENF